MYRKPWPKWIEIGIPSVITAVTIVGIIALTNMPSAPPRVMRVGGCNGNGDCAVRFSDGTTGIRHMPNEGDLK